MLYYARIARGFIVRSSHPGQVLGGPLLFHHTMVGVDLLRSTARHGVGVCFLIGLHYGLLPVSKNCWRHTLRGKLRHLRSLDVSRLSLDLFTSPTCSFDGTSLEVTVTLGLLDECCNPISAIVIGILSVGKCVCKVSGSCISLTC